MDIDVSKDLGKAKEGSPDFHENEEFLFNLGKDLEIFFLYHNDPNKIHDIDDSFALLISKVFTSLSVSTIPYESEKKLYFLMMSDYYRFCFEKKLSCLMEAYSAYLTFKYDIFRLN